MSTKVIIALNSTWNLVNFRAGLIRAMIAHGYEVVAVAPTDKYVPILKQLGCRFEHLPMDNQGTHPVRDLMLFWRYLCLLQRERPAIYLSYTIKPNIYGSLAAHILDVPVINNIAGLGSVFVTNSWLTRLVRRLYRLALSRSFKVFFQNNEDRQTFVSDGLVTESVTDRLPGSGINLSQFAPSPLPSRQPIRFLLIARMLWEKGVGEFVEAARLLSQQGLNAEFCLLGFMDVQNPGAISRKQMDEWINEGFIQYLGTSDDVGIEISRADCIVLPSFYREGTPRTLLEAAAMARPIVTTDSVGCREVVDEGINGYLCRPRDSIDLAEKMAKIANLSLSEREAMGIRGRAKVEAEFDEQLVITKYLEAIDNAISRKRSV